MSIMDDVLLNAKTAVDSVTQKAGKVIDKSKLRLAVIDIRTELSKKYRLLGRICYEGNKTGKNYDKTIKKLLESITELNGQLDSVKELLANTEQKVKCSGCGTYNKKGSLFCNKCGARLNVKSDNEEDYTRDELLDFAEEIMDEEDI